MRLRPQQISEAVVASIVAASILWAADLAWAHVAKPLVAAAWAESSRPPQVLYEPPPLPVVAAVVVLAFLGAVLAIQLARILFPRVKYRARFEALDWRHLTDADYKASSALTLQWMSEGPFSTFNVLIDIDNKGGPLRVISFLFTVKSRDGSTFACEPIHTTVPPSEWALQSWLSPAAVSQVYLAPFSVTSVFTRIKVPLLLKSFDESNLRVRICEARGRSIVASPWPTGVQS